LIRGKFPRQEYDSLIGIAECRRAQNGDLLAFSQVMLSLKNLKYQNLDLIKTQIQLQRLAFSRYQSPWMTSLAIKAVHFLNDPSYAACKAAAEKA